MEHHKISTLLNNSTVLKFATRKWIEINGSSGSQHNVHPIFKVGNRGSSKSPEGEGMKN